MNAFRRDTRATIYELIWEAHDRQEFLRYRDIVARVGRSLSTVYSHVLILREGGVIRGDSLRPCANSPRILPMHLRIKPPTRKPRAPTWRRRKLATSVRGIAVERLDGALRRLSEVPEAASVYEDLLSLREWLDGGRS